MQEPTEYTFIDDILHTVILDCPDVKIYKACLESYPCQHRVCVNNTSQIMGGIEIKKLLEDKNLTSHPAYAHFAGYNNIIQSSSPVQNLNTSPPQSPDLDTFFTRLMLDEPTLKIRSMCLESYPCQHYTSNDDITWKLQSSREIKKQLVTLNLTSHPAYAHFAKY
jgi:hypothetical protein